MEMDRWRVFFDSSGSDLWTVIDWALTIAVVNYPQELRLRRDGFAEKLFAPANFPLLSSNCEALTGSEVPNLSTTKHSVGEEKEDEDRNAAATTTCSYGDAVTTEDGEEEILDEESRQEIRRNEITGIKQQLLSGSPTEEDLVSTLKRLEEMRISVQDLRSTGIGKVVDTLRKKPSTTKRVKAAAKKIICRWKQEVDEWAKTAPAEEKAEIAGDAEDEPDGAATQTGSIDTPQMRDNSVGDDFGDGRKMKRDEYYDTVKPYRLSDAVSKSTNERCKSNPKLNGYRKEIEVQPTNDRVVTPSSKPIEQQQPVRRVDATKRTPATKLATSNIRAVDNSPECFDRLEAAKRRLAEQYQQAANVKKQRTVQVMGLQDVPQQDLHKSIGKGFSNGKRGTIAAHR